MNKLLPILFGLLLLHLATSESFQLLGKDKTVVESNHFFSSNLTENMYTLDNIKIGKPLLLVLRKKTDYFQNQVKVLFQAASNSVTCKLQSYNDICVLPEVQSTEINMSIQCLQTPCQVYWIIYQFQANNTNYNELPQGLYTLKQQLTHLVVIITCNDPLNKQFNKDVNLYSTNGFQRSGSLNQIYFLFEKQKDGYLYIDIEKHSQACAHISITNVPIQVAYSNNQIRDFTNNNSPAVAHLDFPKSDFRIDVLLHPLDLTSNLQSVTFRLLGLKQTTITEIQSFEIEPSSLHEKQSSFSITFKKIDKTLFNVLQLEIVSQSQKMTIINYAINEAEIQEIELGQHNYFSLKKEEIIKYKIQANQDANQADQIYIILEDKENATLSTETCFSAKGCVFEIKAEESIKSNIYVSSSPKHNDKQPIQFLPLVKRTKHKIRDGSQLYFKRHVKANKAFEVTINSPNALMYAASQQKCPIPSSQCYERKGNYQNPFVYTPKTDGQFLINVEGLDMAQVIIAVLEQKDEFIKLQDGVTFSYVIDENQDSIKFKYTLKEKIAVSFNLIAPLNHLMLVVHNNKNPSEFLESVVSSEGFISYQKDDINDLQFTITVKKTDLTLNKLTHFTILASTSDSILRLQPTVAHYQTIQSKTSKQYVLQYDPSQQYILNFYMHNLKIDNISILLILANSQFKQDLKQKHQYIKSQSDYVDLKQMTKSLCKDQAPDRCQIFVKILNQMDVQIDITITLLMRDSIIELKDGIWQSYLENTIASSANFYFNPKHHDQDVVIIYSTVRQDLRLVFDIWKTDSKSLNPSQWPFPTEIDPKTPSSTKALSHVTIDKQVLKKHCWPNCLILITLFRDKTINANYLSNDVDFKIMVSNNMIELPEETRINLELKQNQQKEIVVDLKYAMEKEQIVFFTTFTIGDLFISANIISEKNQRCPQQDETIDFLILNGETNLQVGLIKQKLKQLKMQEDGNIFLCVSIRATQNSKLSIQYITGTNSIKKLNINSFEEITLSQNSKKIYQIQGYYDFIVKMVRKSGYPYMYIKKCTFKELKSCKQHVLTTQDKGNQIVEKTQQFEEQPCSQCVYFIKFQAIQPCIIDLHMISSRSEIELKEHEIISDFIEQDYVSRYVITRIFTENLIINIHALDGDIEATITNNEKINLRKRTSADKKTIHFYIPGQQHKQKSNATSLDRRTSLISSFLYSNTFNFFHLSLKSIESNKTATFTITYSSGNNQIHLQDGLFTDIILEPKIPLTFTYENDRASPHIYLILSAKTAEALKDIEFKAYYIEQQVQNQPEAKVEFSLDIPPLSKKQVNPTLLILLPSKNYFQISIRAKSEKPEPLSLGINHQQLIILPLQHQYPFILHKRDYIYFLVEVSQPGYISIKIRKCDRSQPTLSFTTNYQSFVDQEFTNNIELNDDPRFEEIVHIEKPGPLYIKISSEDQPSLLSVYLKYSKEMSKKQIVKAGGKGQLKYQLSQSKKATVTFSPLTCGNTECSGIKYFMISSQDSTSLFSQLVCPSSYFMIENIVSTNLLPLLPIEVKQGEMPSFTYELPNHVSFVAVKAVNNQGQEFYYKPVQIVTFWGHLSRTSKGHKYTIAGIIIVSICGLLMFVHYNARKGYRRISENMTE